MAPKKKKIVGARSVSTRSTRREVTAAVVTKPDPLSIAKRDAEPTQHIIDILNDWSDEDEDEESVRNTIVSETSASSISADQQSLINILEGEDDEESGDQCKEVRVKEVIEEGVGEDDRSIIIDILPEEQASYVEMKVTVSQSDDNDLEYDIQMSGENSNQGSDKTTHTDEADLCEKVEGMMKIDSASSSSSSSLSTKVEETFEKMTLVEKEEKKPTKRQSRGNRKVVSVEMLNNIDATIDAVLKKYSLPTPTPTSVATKKKMKKKVEEENPRRSDRIRCSNSRKKSHGVVVTISEPAQPKVDKVTTPPQVKVVEETKVQVKETSESVPISTKPDDHQGEIETAMKNFVVLKDNQYRTDRQLCKEAREMECDCFLAEEDIENNEYGCGDDCLNRLLMIECGDSCQAGTRCTNRRFQKSSFAPVEVFKTEKKGLGLRAAANIPYGEFILEYVGEVLDPSEFDKRAEVYSTDKNIHFYFMSLRADAIIDATMKGNISRFINHSCEPNAETQKWTVKGELRIGFFSTRTILAGEEITFDYQFQRYGKEAQKCFCEAPTCRGWLGEQPSESEDEDEEEEDEEAKKEAAKSQVAEDTAIPVQISDKTVVPTDIDNVPAVKDADKTVEVAPLETTPSLEKKKKKKARKDVLYEVDFDNLNEEIEMLVTTGLKNQAHTLKLSRLMVRAKDPDQRKKLLRVLRRGELPCRRLFLDYHGLRLIHGYMTDATALRRTNDDVNQTKLELLQTLAVLPIQNRTTVIESKVLPAVEKWAANEDIEENGAEIAPALGNGNDKVEEIKFLATKLLEEWANLKEIFRIPKRERVEQMKEHEKEANRKYKESSYTQEKESTRKLVESRQRSIGGTRMPDKKRSSRQDENSKDRPSAEFLKISKYERRKLFALQMEVKEEERRSKQREMWRQHEINCMMIGADPRFTAPFDPSKAAFQYNWNPAARRWQQYTADHPSISGYPVKPPGPILDPYAMMNVAAATPHYPPGLPPMVPGTAAPHHPHLSALPHSLALAGQMPALPIYQPPPQEIKEELEDPSQVKFAGPIPPPVDLPPKWKRAYDKYGRPYYYHVKIRKSQWEPPPLPLPVQVDQSLSDSSESSETTTSSSSNTSSSSSESGGDSDDDDVIEEAVDDEGEDDDDVVDDSRLLRDVRKQIAERAGKTATIKKTEKNDESLLGETKKEELAQLSSSIDKRIREQFDLDDAHRKKKRRRAGLCQEIIISPRTEEDRRRFKEDLKRFRATKLKLKRQRELQQQKSSKRPERTPKTSESITKPVTSTRRASEWNDDHSKKIKETFRSAMAGTVVNVLNAFRKPDCKEARIVSTEDFKHLARKLTHFVMLKEVKHLSSIDDLVCTDNVKSKAREYIKKYMSKFGEVYQKRQDEPDYKD